MKQTSKIFIFIGMFSLLFVNLTRREMKEEHFIIMIGIGILSLLVGVIFWILFQNSKDKNTAPSKNSETSKKKSQNKLLKFLGIGSVIVGGILFVVAKFLDPMTAQDRSTLFYVLAYTGSFLILTGIFAWWSSKRKI